MDGKVCVTLVTYNRKNYLLKLLEAIKNQTYSISGIIIVDNSSSDGTYEALKECGYVSKKNIDQTAENKYGNTDIIYYYSSKNTGGSGGFNKAIEIFLNYGYDYAWIMDDDVLPEQNCLKELIKYIDKDAQACIPNRSDNNYTDCAIQKFNLTNPLLFHVNQCKQDVIESYNITNNYICVEDMAFEGPLISRNVIKKVGLPNKDYFILFDDTDYAHKIIQFTKIRFVKNAQLHKQIVPTLAKAKWTWKTFYTIRNAAYFDRMYGKNWMVKYIRPQLRLYDLIARSIFKGNFYRIKWILKAHNDGIHGKLGKTVGPEEF